MSPKRDLTTQLYLRRRQGRVSSFFDLGHNRSSAHGAFFISRPDRNPANAQFERGETYTGLMHFFWIGVSRPSAPCVWRVLTTQPVVTVIVWLLYRRYPQSLLRYINVPIFFNAAGNIPPANTSTSTPFRHCPAHTLAQYSLWFIFGFLFNYLIRQRAIGWWKRYNCA